MIPQALLEAFRALGAARHLPRKALSLILGDVALGPANGLEAWKEVLWLQVDQNLALYIRYTSYTPCSIMNSSISFYI